VRRTQDQSDGLWGAERESEGRVEGDVRMRRGASR